MPISREEYEHGEIDATVYLLQLLRSYSDTAFSAIELSQIAANEGRNMEPAEIADRLNPLVAQATVECKEVGGVLYYIYRRRPLGFRPGGR